MGIRKTLGKDTLGGGNKINVDLRTYDRSTHDLSYAFRTPMGCGTLVPCMAEVAQPQDVFDIDINAKVLTHPTTGPLLGSFKLQVDLFVVPWRNYIRQLQLNALNVGLKMDKIPLPYIESKALSGHDIGDTTSGPKKHISQSSLLAYLGTRGWGITIGSGETAIIKKQCIKYIGYYDIFKNFYANKQEAKYYRIEESSNYVYKFAPDNARYENGILKSGSKFNIDLNKVEQSSLTDKLSLWLQSSWGFGGHYVNSSVWKKYGTLTQRSPNDGKHYLLTINTDWDLSVNMETIEGATTAGNGIELKARNLSEIDDLREWLMEKESETSGCNVKHDLLDFFKKAPDGHLATLTPQYGLCVKTYQSDIFNCWIDSERVDGPNGISAITAIDVSSGKLDLDTLSLSKKVYEMMTRISASGGTFSDYIEVNYNSKPSFAPNTPYYVGGMSDEIVFDEIVSMAAAEGEPVGTLAGKGMNAGKPKGGKLHFKVDEPAYVMGIVSITPRVDYSQGNAWDDYLVDMDDLHKPALDQIGYQDLLARNMYWAYDTVSGKAPKVAVGKQPAWLWYQTNYNKNYGQFAVGEEFDFMVLNRPYHWENRNSLNSSTYINPNEYYSIFAQQTLEQQPFWVQLGFRVTKRSVMSAHNMPLV